ncbi:hypothetical protein EYC84_006961 [Monilinia fructicola]|uniref:Uncharacterized protein n=1 Tax=Monilinia fructicola TaxID=38448 RepID=A0A5M9K9J6_MONFR|nr:hypothetical protein EYC84_006961 [Monilinia fructicola]
MSTQRPQHRNPLCKGSDSERSWFARHVRIGSMGSIKVAASVRAARLFLAYFMALEVWGILLCFPVSVFRESSLAVSRAARSSAYIRPMIGPCNVVRLMIDAEIVFHRSRQK